MTTPSWIAEHRAAFSAKPALAAYYREEIFARVLGWAPEDPVLEIGAGPGLLAEHSDRVLSTDVIAGPRTRVIADGMALPFADQSVGGVVCVDVVHHLGAPSRALAEIARVLRPGGRFVACEPWAGTLGRLFYHHLHHEDCLPVDQPMDRPFPAAEGKDPMDGNAWIARAVLRDRAAELADRGIPLHPRHLETFGVLSYPLTGGFQPWSAPAWMVRSTLAVERLLPRRLMPHLALRFLAVLERGPTDTSLDQNP